MISESGSRCVKGQGHGKKDVTMVTPSVHQNGPGRHHGSVKRRDSGWTDVGHAARHVGNVATDHVINATDPVIAHEAVESARIETDMTHVITDREESVTGHVTDHHVTQQSETDQRETALHATDHHMIERNETMGRHMTNTRGRTVSPKTNNQAPKRTTA